MDNLVPFLVGVIVTAVIAFLIRYKREISIFFKRKEGRFSGVWVGAAKDIEVKYFIEYKYPLRYHLKCDIKQSGNTVEGFLYVTSDMKNKLYFRGTIYDNIYLIGESHNTKYHYRDKGMIVAEINGKGDVIKGFMGGIRLRENGIVIGNFQVSLQQKKEPLEHK